MGRFRKRHRIYISLGFDSRWTQYYVVREGAGIFSGRPIAENTGATLPSRSLQKKSASDFAFNQMTYPQSNLCKLYNNHSK
jgi:hypothetical protein